MAGPPKDIPASELFIRLCEIPRPSEVVDFPRKDPDTGKPVGRIRIQVLTMMQHDEARIKAFRKLRKEQDLTPQDLESSLLKEVYGDRVAREILAMCCLREEPIQGTAEAGRPMYARVFPKTDDLDGLSADELTVLFSCYEITQHRYGPHSGSVATDEEVTAWIERLAEGASAYPLAGQSWHQLADLCISLAARAYGLSAHLGSLSESLPATLDALPASWGIGTGSFGKRAAESIDPGADGSAEQPKVDDLPEEPITTEQAAKIARTLFDKR